MITFVLRLLTLAIVLISFPVRAEDEAAPTAGGATTATGAVTGEGGSSTGVSASTGTPAVSYPFKLPPGRLTPNLTLHYVMGGGNLEGGHGWALNVPSIVRVKRPKIPSALVGSGPFMLPRPPFPFFGNNLLVDGPVDQFEIDGEPLIPICRISAAARCIETGAEPSSFPSWAAGGILFRRQNDPEYTQYLWLDVDHYGATHEGERTWIERSKNGHVRIFGAPGAEYNNPGIYSETLYEDYVLPDGGPVPVKWNLCAEYDSNRFANGQPSNVIQYIWSRSPGQHADSRAYLTQVIYDPPSAGAPLANWAHRVLLSWQLPKHAVADYAPAWATRPAAHLSQVTASSFVGHNASSREIIRTYHLSHSYWVTDNEPQSRSHLQSIQLQGRTGASEPTVGWSDNPSITGAQPPLLPATTFSYSTGYGSQGLAQVDTILNANAMPFSPSSYGAVSVLDINRDGLPDLYRGDYFEGGPARVYMNTGANGSAPSFEERCASILGIQMSVGPKIDRSLESAYNGLTLNNLQAPYRGMDAFASPPYVTNLWCNLHLEEVPASPSVCDATLIGGQSKPGYLWVKDDCTSYEPTSLTRCEKCWEKNDVGCTQKPDCFDVNLTGDIDGDGLTDLLTQKFRWDNSTSIGGAELHFSGVWGGSTKPLAIPVASAVVLGQNSQTSLVDLNGDGFADLFTATSPTTVGAWYGRGDGTFDCSPPRHLGASHSCTFHADQDVCIPGTAPGQCRPGMALTGLEELGNYDICHGGGAAAEGCGFWPWSRRAHLYSHDINGDGLEDLIRLDPGDFIGSGQPNGPHEWQYEQLFYSVWINHDGVHFNRHRSNRADGRFVMQHSQPGLMHNLQGNAPYGTPLYMYSDARIAFADMNASGTDDLVVVYQDGVQYVDFGGGGSDLLTRVDNGYGGYTTYEYATLQRVGFGKNWTTKVDRVIPVVTAQTQGVDGPNFVDRASRTIYTYENPAYDSWKRSLVGFATVVEQTLSDTVTVRGYEFGRCETSVGCGVPGMTSDDDFHTAISGVPTYELLSDGTLTQFPYGRVLWKKQTSFDVIARVGIDGRRAWAALPVDRLEYQYNPTETQSLTWESTVVGTEKSCEACPAGATTSASVPSFNGPSTALRRWRNRYSAYGNLQQEFAHGRVNLDLSPGVDGNIATSHYVERLPGDGYQFIETESQSGGPDGSRQRMFEYDAHGNLHREYAYLSGTRALRRGPYYSPLVPAPLPPGRSPTAGWIATQTYEYDEFGKVVEQRGAPVLTAQGLSEAACKVLIYDPPGAVLPTTVDTSPNCSGIPFVNNYVNDPGFGVQMSSSSPAVILTRDEYDAFGRHAKHFAPHPTLMGMTEALPQSWAQYPENADGTVDVVSKTLQFSRRPDGTIAQTVEYTDGAFAHILTVTEEDPGRPSTHIISGQVERDNLGRAVRTWRPRGYTGDPLAVSLAASPSPNQNSDSTWFGYDAFGRHVVTSDGDTPVYKIERKPLEETIWDAEDLKASGTHAGSTRTLNYDGHGREVKVTQRSGSETLLTLTAYSFAGEVLSRTSIANGVTKNQFLYTYDTLGRMVSATELNSRDAANQEYIFAYNDAGSLVGTTDPTGCGENLHYDGFGRLIARDFSPCRADQQRYTPPDLNNGDGTEVYYQYDRRGGLYGAPGGGMYWGRVVSIQDRGAMTTMDYDVRGRQVRTERQIAKPGTTVPQLAARYTPHSYSQRTSYDSLDRPTDVSTGADAAELLGTALGASSSIVRTNYSNRGLVASLTSSYGPLSVQTYKVDGQPDTTQYGDLAQTHVERSYDSRHRLSRFRLLRSEPSLWSSTLPNYTPASTTGGTRATHLVDSGFEYDEVGNPTRISDDRIALQWPDGAKPRDITIAYDDMYRTKRVEYGTTDVYVSPFEKENTEGDTRPLPHRITGSRANWQSYDFDIFGDLRSSDDDQHLVWDRSLGAVVHDEAGGHPSRLVSSGPSQDIKARYDAAGRLTDIVVNRSGACSSAQGCNVRFRYQWDEVGQLAKADRWDSTTTIVPSPTWTLPSGSPSVSIRYRYSVEGRAAKEITVAGDPTVHTIDIFGSLYLKDATYDVTEYEHGAYTQQVVLPNARLVYGQGALPLTSSGEARLFFVGTDALGSTNIVFDAKTSEVIEAREYGPFGTTESDFRPARWQAFRDRWHFTGKEEDSEVGLVYMGARYYSPSLGQFISPDPLPITTGKGDLNVYAYVRGQSYRAVDPTGLDGEDAAQHGSAGGSPSITSQMHHVTISKRTAKTIVEPYWQGEGNGMPSLYRYESTNGPGAQGRHVLQAAGNSIISHAIRSSLLPGASSPVESLGHLLGYPSIGASIADRILPIDKSASPLSLAIGGLAPTALSVATVGVAAGVESLSGRVLGGSIEGGLAGDVGSVGAMMRYRYVASPKHPVGVATRAGVSAGPQNGQAALDSSVSIGPNTARRVGIDYATGEFAVFDETFIDRGIFHGHVRTWDQLEQGMQNALTRSGLTNRRGSILMGE